MDLKVKPRLYQEQLFAKAVKDNTLIVLPTGLGKTLIALMMTLHYLKRGKVLILAPTKPLVSQHYQSFIKDSSLEESDCVIVSGAVKPEERTYSERVVFATPQTIRNDVLTQRLKLSDFSLIVFDEAHRATGNYAYNFIASQFTGRVLGLSASPGSDASMIKMVCQNLGIVSIESRTERDPDVKPYLKEKKINYIELALPEDYEVINHYLKKTLSIALKDLKREGVLDNYNINKIYKRELLKVQRTALREKQYQALSLTAKAIKVMHALELLQTQGVESLKDYLKSINSQSSKASRQLVDEHDFIKATRYAFKSRTPHPKIAALKELVVPEEKQLIFTQYRQTAELITKELQDSGMKAQVFVGQRGKKGMTQKEQLRVLERFRKGEFNTLVSTSVHPDEFIVVRDDKKRVHIKPIGEFVNSFLRNGKLSDSINGWESLSFHKGKVCFKRITHVHKHKRQSNVVKVKFSSGFEALITEDHSLFSFNKAKKLVSVKPEKDLFALGVMSSPKSRNIASINLVKAFLDELPKSELSKVYCKIVGLSQSLMRVLRSNHRFLKAINGIYCLSELSQKTGLDRKSIALVLKRLQAKDFVFVKRTTKKKIPLITKKGIFYLDFLTILFKHLKYYKMKYRISLEAVNKMNRLYHGLKILLQTRYGKTELPVNLKVTKSLAEFLGFYVSEGYLGRNKHGYKMFIAALNKELRKKVINSIINGFGLSPKVYKKGIAVDSHLVFLLLKYVLKVGLGSYNKEVPQIIFNSDDEIKMAFLEAYHLGDGYNDDSRIVFTTVSRKLVMGLILLLRSLNINKITLGQQRHVYKLKILESLPFAKLNNSKSKTRCYYNLSPKALVDEAYWLKFSNYYFRGKHSRLIKPPKEVYYDYIKQINVLKEQPVYVYDLSVQDSQLFCGGLGLIALHNSISEEGLDIPSIDTAIFFEPVPSALRMVQRRGRVGRAKTGKVHVLITKGTVDEKYKWVAHYKEKRMRKALKNLNQEELGQKSLKNFF